MTVKIDLLEKATSSPQTDKALPHSDRQSTSVEGYQTNIAASGITRSGSGQTFSSRAVQPRVQIQSLADYGKSLGIGAGSPVEPQKQLQVKKTSIAQPVRNYPTAADKTAFLAYKKQLKREQRNLPNTERIQQRILSFWVPAKYRIGISIITNDQLLGQAIGSTPTGVRVQWFASDSPAKKVLQVADIISEANGVTIQNAEHFKEVVKGMTKKNMQLKIQRNYEILEKTVHLKKQK